jgi:hypothetical protein
VSTTHIRQTPSGVRVAPKHSVGMSMPCARQASRIVESRGTLTGRPSMVSSTRPGSSAGGGPGRDGERAGVPVKMTGSTPVNGSLGASLTSAPP